MLLTYSPSNKAHDGTYRKIKVQLVDHDGNPVALKDEKNKPMKYSIVAKAGYKAPRAAWNRNKRVPARFVKRSISRFCITMPKPLTQRLQLC